MILDRDRRHQYSKLSLTLLLMGCMKLQKDMIRFLGGPFDTSILVSDVDHATLRLWVGEVRNENFN